MTTNTGCSLYSIHWDDVYAEWKRIFIFFYTYYPLDLPCYNNTNKKVVGKFSDETHRKLIRKFILLRAKCYSLFFTANSNKKVITRTAIEERLRHPSWVSFNTVCSFLLPRVSTWSSQSAYPACNWTFPIRLWRQEILDNGLETLAYGHYRITK